MLEGLLEIPGINPVCQKQNDFKPFSPGSDSGLSSPGSVWDVDDRFSPSPDVLSLDQTYEPNQPVENVSDHLFTNVLPELSGLDMTNAFRNGPVLSDNNQSIERSESGIEDMTMEPIHEGDLTSRISYNTTSTNHITNVVDCNTQIIVPETKELLDELGIKVAPYAPPVKDYKVIFMPQSTDVGNKKVISIENENKVAPYIVATNISAVDCVSESSKPKGGRKRKICSVQERRERKREQNKNAATRYRERKRKEMANREGQLQALKDKNTSLKDETNRVNREIDYLRELLVEVYKLKGLIT